MNLEDIDQIFRDNQRQFDKMPAEEVWLKLEHRLSVERSPVVKTKNLFFKRKTWLYVAAAALVILLVSPITLYLLKQNESEKTGQIALLNEPVGNNEKAVAEISAHDSMYSSELMKSEENIQAAQETKSYITKKSIRDSKLKKEDIENDETIASSESQPPYGSTPMASAPNAEKEITKTTQDVQFEENSKLFANVESESVKGKDQDYLNFSRYYSPLDDNTQSLRKSDRLASEQIPASKTTPSAKSAEKDKSSGLAEKRAKPKTVTDKTSTPAKTEVSPGAGITNQIDNLTQISWLWGIWTKVTDGIQISETWNSNGTGTISTHQNDKTVFSESSSIKSTNNTLVYILKHPETGKEAYYPLSGISTDKDLIFENRELPYPNQIRYQLISPSTLSVTFSDEINRPGYQNTIILNKQ